jgi:hypothetical protein
LRTSSAICCCSRVLHVALGAARLVLLKAPLRLLQPLERRRGLRRARLPFRRRLPHVVRGFAQLTR